MDVVSRRLELLKLREPAVYSDEDLKALAKKFSSRVEGNKLEGELERQHSGEPLTLKCHVEFSTRAEVTERTLAVCEAFGLGVDEAKHFVAFDDFSLAFGRGDLVHVTGDSGGGKTLLNLLSEFAQQSFIKTKKVTPDLLPKVFSTECVYLYWVNDALLNGSSLPKSGNCSIWASIAFLHITSSQILSHVIRPKFFVIWSTRFGMSVL